MPSIPFPNVPAFPGVPALTRPVSAVIAQTPVLAIGLGSLETILGNALQQAPQWGIFDQQGNQLGLGAIGPSSVLSVIESNALGGTTTLSTFCFEYGKEVRVSDFPVEGGSFATYNKVETPGNPTVTLALAGSEDDRTNFLTAIDNACTSTDLFNVITPEFQYINYTVERYTYSRRADRGATLLVVDISLKEVRAVTAAFSTATGPIQSPQNAAATPAVNGGIVQTATPEQSTLLQGVNKISSAGAAFFGTN